MNKPPKKASPKDIADWQDETIDVTPLPQPDEPPQSPLIIDEIKPSVDAQNLYNHNSFNLLEIGNVSNIDRKLAEKFTSGKLKIEARLDLHGLTEKQAFNQVCNFIHESYTQKRRCILIITGKGIETSSWWEKKGIIKQSFPNWLNHIEIRPYLLAAAPARPQDGGDGAFYCLLKRQR